MGVAAGVGRDRDDVILWVDADAAPQEVKAIVFRASKRVGVQTILVANRSLVTPHDNPLVTSAVVDGGLDVADRYIADHAREGDIVITQDIPLAAQLVSRGIAVIDPRGDEHTVESIGERLSMRDFMVSLRGAGAITGGPAAYDERAKRAFASALDRTLTRLMR